MKGVDVRARAMWMGAAMAMALAPVAARGQAGAVPPSEKAGNAPAQSAPTAATAPATTVARQATTRTRFDSGDPVDDLLAAMALRFDVIVIEPKPVSAVLPRAVQLPDKLEDAVALAREILEPQGFAIVQSVTRRPVAKVMLRVLTTAEARKAALDEAPVTSGIDPGKIDVKDPEKLVSHILPVAHAETIDSLKKTATQDRQVSAEIAGTPESGLSLIVSGPAAKVKRAVAEVVAIDKPGDVQTVVRQLKLKNLDAMTTADSLNATFASQPKNGPVPRAVGDKRTNTVIVTGPEGKVVDALVEVLQMDLAAAGRGGTPESGSGAPGALPPTRGGR